MAWKTSKRVSCFLSAHRVSSHLVCTARCPTASLLERAQVPCSWLLSLLPGLLEFGSAKLAGWGSQLVSWAGSVAAQRRIFHTLLQNKCKISSHHHVAKTDATLIPCTRCDAGHSFLARGSRVKAFQTSRKGIGTS